MGGGAQLTKPPPTQPLAEQSCSRFQSSEQINFIFSSAALYKYLSAI